MIESQSNLVNQYSNCLNTLEDRYSKLTRVYDDSGENIKENVCLDELKNIAEQNPHVTAIATRASYVISSKIEHMSMFKNLTSFTCVQPVFVNVNLQEEAPQLKEFKLQKASNITDNTLGKLPLNIETLEFSECLLELKQINIFKRFKKLHTLKIIRNEHHDISDEMALTFPEQLRHLDISSCNFWDEDLRSLKKCASLKHLYLDDNPWITVQALQLIPSQIEVVSLRGCDILNNVALQHCQKWTNLKQLYLSRITRVSSLIFKTLPTTLQILHCASTLVQDLSDIERLVELEELILTENDLSECSCAALPPKIRKLDLGSCKLQDKQIEQLKKLTCLTHLNISNAPQITDCAFVHLQDMNTLIHLDISMNKQLTTGALGNLPTSLEVLLLEGNNYSDEVMEHLKLCPELSTLNLNQNCRITGSKLHLLSKNMKHLHLAKCSIDDSAARCFSAFTSLITLDLRDNPLLSTAVTKIFPQHIKALNISSIPKQDLHIEHISLQKSDTLEIRKILSRIASVWSKLAKFWHVLSLKQSLADATEFGSSGKICELIQNAILENLSDNETFLYDAVVAFDPDNKMVQAIALTHDGRKDINLAFLATNPYNIRSSHTTLNNLTRTSQAASSIITYLKQKIIDSASISKIILQPTISAISFYEKLGFILFENGHKYMKWEKSEKHVQD